MNLRWRSPRCSDAPGLHYLRRLWHGTLLLKESASKLTFYAFYRRCNLLSCYLLLPGGRYSTVIRGLIAIFRKCIISLYFGIEGGIPHFRQRCYPGTVLKAGGYIFNRPAILKNITGYSSNMGLSESSPEKSRLYAFCE